MHFLIGILALVYLDLAESLFVSLNGEDAQQPLAVSKRPDGETVLLAYAYSQVSLALAYCISLKKAEVITDVLDLFNVKFLINPFWPETHKRVELGNRLSPDDLDLIPDLELSLPLELLNEDAKIRYTLVLSDPDALSHDNPVKAQMCHWIVTNITLPDLVATTSGYLLHLQPTLASESESGIVQLKSYLPPAPPPRTGYHRYVFAFLKSAAHDSELPKAPQERPHWGYGKNGAGIREWTGDNNLTVIAANFFYAQNPKQ